MVLLLPIDMIKSHCTSAVCLYTLTVFYSILNKPQEDIYRLVGWYMDGWIGQFVMTCVLRHFQHYSGHIAAKAHIFMFY